MRKKLYSIMFHHFHDDKGFYKSQGSISLKQFRIILDYLQNHYNLINAQEFLYKFNKKSLKNNDVCLSFDDGLKSQYIIAKEELKKRNIKAFFFIYSSIFTSKTCPLEFYRDFRFTKFSNIDHFYTYFLDVFNKIFPNEFVLFKEKYTSSYLAEYPFYTENDKKFRFVRDIILGEVKYFELMEIMLLEFKYNKEEKKDKLLINEKELKEINSDGHLIGLHSHSHPTSIDELSYTEQFEEYSKNLNILEKITNNQISSMSHPVGKYNKYTLKVLENLDIEIGFNSSLSNSNILSRYEIPREDHINLYKKIVIENK